uniref:Putative nucleolar protein 12 n=1 Tax=Nyssomyia neivai TaxID=330878 RepID=A0A1L8DHW8_9DIPT
MPEENSPKNVDKKEKKVKKVKKSDTQEPKEDPQDEIVGEVLPGDGENKSSKKTKRKSPKESSENENKHEKKVKKVKKSVPVDEETTEDPQDVIVDDVLPPDEENNSSKKSKRKSSKHEDKKAKKMKKSDPEDTNEDPQDEIIDDVPPGDEESDTSDSEDESEKQKKEKIAYDPAEASRTIFVGNLPTNTKQNQLKTFLKDFGEIKTIRFRTYHGEKIQNCRQVKNHRCITAYVVFTTDEAAIGATLASGKIFRNAHIRIMMADGKKKYFDGKRTVFVGNLTYAVTDDDLFEVFQSCGEIQYVRTLTSPLGCKGTAYVCFKNPESVGLALELNQTMMNDRPIRVERYKNKPKIPKGGAAQEKGKPGGKKSFGKKDFRAKKDVKRLQKGGKPQKNYKNQEKNTPDNKNRAEKQQERKEKFKKIKKMQKDKNKDKKKHRSLVNMKLAKKLNPQLKKSSTKVLKKSEQ